MFHKPDVPFVSILTLLNDLEPSFTVAFAFGFDEVLIRLSQCRLIGDTTYVARRSVIIQKHALAEASKSSLEDYRTFEVKLTAEIQQNVMELKLLSTEDFLKERGR